MKPTTLRLHTAHRVGAVDPRIFGGFLEHMGRAVYEGVYDPGSQHADADGCRSDVLAALGRMGMTAMRYPGGNFASGYHWTDGVGPRAGRPTVRELAWQSIETNQFGTDEFVRLCRAMGWTPMLTVNLGTGTPEEARNWVEYCNCPAGTRWADLRATNGVREPHGVKLWCLGNEMDGPWQLGHVPAEQYAIRAQQAAKMMRDTDPGIELVACGSCGVDMKTYMEWDRQVLEYLGDFADYLSLHRYVGNRKDDTADFLAVTAAVDRQIEEMDAACRFVQARRRSKRRAYLCFDEWNVWYKNMEMNGRGQRAPHLIEEVYNLEDALVVAGFLNSFIRHADAVKIANIAQIANVIAPVLTRGDELLVQTILYPFEMISRRRDGTALRIALDGPSYESPSHGVVPVVDASAILGEGTLSVFLTNRSLDEKAEVRVELAGAGGGLAALRDAELLSGPGAKAANSFEQQDVVRSQPFAGAAVRNGVATVELPPLSFAAVTFGAG
jgi:alpha-N-arabinofuranosidase